MAGQATLVEEIASTIAQLAQRDIRSASQRDRKGAGSFLAFQRLYLASGGVNFDRSRAVQPKPRKPGQGFVSQDLPVAN